MMKFKSIKINYALFLYLLSSLISFGLVIQDSFTNNAFLSIILIIILAFGAFLNAKNNRTLRSICWPFFLNAMLSLTNIFGIVVFGSYQNILISSNDIFSDLQLIQFFSNFYFPFLDRVEKLGDLMVYLYFMLVSFLIPFIGFKIGQYTTIKKL